ncbi:MAG: hypothetical protein HY554_10825 [Elusimicrobia bacterium]|nr:hypothetical protein [Elusimicrobiota bacterium]
MSAKLKAMDDPCAAAAAIVQASLSVALRSIPEDKDVNRRLAIQEACQGAMTGLLLSEQNTTRGAVLILSKVAEVANDYRMDPSAAMESALRGIADIRRFLLPERLAEMRVAVDAAFLGAGEALRKFLDEARAVESA